MPEGTVQPKIALPELDDDCKICGKETDSTAGNPSDWPVRISRHDGSGLRWTYHQGCVASALTQLSELRAASEWVSVEDRLPESSKTQMFLVYGYGRYAVAAQPENTWWCEMPWDDITHWKPLPLPPQPSPASAVEENDDG